MERHVIELADESIDKPFSRKRKELPATSMKDVAKIAVTVAVFCSLAAVSVAGSAPMADAGLDQTVSVDTAVQLDGTGSAHPDGELSAYEWTIERPDGETETASCADCERTQFTPSSAGRYEVTLRVTAADGTDATDTLFVYVEDAGPSVSLDGNTAPEPAEPVEFDANAESLDAELEEIAWAIEDEIISVQSLSGQTADSSLPFAFTETKTHRVQVVVRDTNGRTAYDQLLVRPQDVDSTPSNWEETATETVTPGCSDQDYRYSNPVECLGISRPSTPEQTPTLEDEHALYETDGYEQFANAGAEIIDSAYTGLQTRDVGLDGGENAPWNNDLRDRVYDSTIGKASNWLFGQERETATCEVTGGEANSCSSKIYELENDGETTNVYSQDDSGQYSEYGLTDAERIAGTDPTDLGEGQTAEVTVVIQQEEEGVVDKAIRTAEDTNAPDADQISNYADAVFGTGEQEGEETDTDGGDADDTTTSDTATTSDSSTTNRDVSSFGSGMSSSTNSDLVPDSVMDSGSDSSSSSSSNQGSTSTNTQETSSSRSGHIAFPK